MGPLVMMGILGISLLWARGQARADVAILLQVISEALEATPSLEMPID
jgi:hypothetical protein